MMEEQEAGPSKQTRRVRERVAKKREDEVVEEMSSTTHWKKKEISAAVEALDKFGVTRINKISEAIPHKTPDQVKTWLWRMARNHALMKERRAERREEGERWEDEGGGVSPGAALATSKDRLPLNRTKQLSAVSKTLLLLENYEDHPPPSSPQDVHIKQLYTAVYMAMKGYPLPNMNTATQRFFYDSVYNVLRVASLYQMNHSVPLQDDQINKALENLSEDAVLNPLSLHPESLKARIDLDKASKTVPVKNIKNWLSDQDQNLL